MNHKQVLSLWILAIVVLLALGAARPALAQYGIAQAKTSGFSDAMIASKVKAALGNDAALRKMDISVEVLDKVVHLSGFVSSLADMAKAEKLARAVEGVAAVRNGIRVENRPTRA